MIQQLVSIFVYYGRPRLWSFDNELFGNIGEAGRHVWDVVLGNVVFCDGVEDFAELGLTCVAIGR